MSNVDSPHFYFVTAPVDLGAAQGTTMGYWMDRLRRACAAETAGAQPRIEAMVCLPDRVMAVIRSGHWAGASPYRPARPWRRRRPAPLMCSMMPGLTAQRLDNEALIAERVDHCHFAPVAAGLVPHPEDWAHSTAATTPMSDMLVA